MSIHFSPSRWEEIQKNYTSWWNGTSARPLIKVTVKKAYAPVRKRPDTPLLSMKNCHDFSYTAEEIIDALDYELEQTEFLGDAFPFVNLHAFGPSTLAGFCGAQMDNSTGSVWYFPKEKKPLEEIHIQYDPENKWVKRIKSLYLAGYERWGDTVLMSMPDLGGFQDVMASFAGSNELLFALMDEPEEVLRLQGEVYRAFMEAYEDLGGVLRKKNRGWSDWGGIYSEEPSYILQDDFAYMISPRMFEEFALPEIAMAAKKLTNTIYHLDGVGNLNHIEYLLNNPDINAIQWVYGAGQPSARHWMEVYDKIYKAGKGIEVIGDPEDFNALYPNYGNRLFYHVLIDDPNGTCTASADEKDCLNDYGIVTYENRDEALDLLKYI